MKKFFNSVALALVATVSTCAMAVAQPMCFTEEDINRINEAEGFEHAFDGVVVREDGTMLHMVIFANPISAEWVQLVSPDLDCYYVFESGILGTYNHQANL